MKYIGIFLIMISALLIIREYSAYMKKRLAECEGFLAFISHIRIEIGCFLRPVKELGATFESKALADSGFLSALAGSESIYEAYKKCRPSLSLSKEEDAALQSLFSNLGEGYLEDGVRLIDSSHEKWRRSPIILGRSRQKISGLLPCFR